MKKPPYILRALAKTFRDAAAARFFTKIGRRTPVEQGQRSVRRRNGSINRAMPAKKLSCVGQSLYAWPEIRQLLAAGHSLKDVCAWLNECGMEIGYARLSDYVNRLRRTQSAPPELASVTESGEAKATGTDPFVEPPKPERVRKEGDPLANVRASEAKRPGFHYRPAEPADEKDLI